MKIEIWSDIACPFCYIGEQRLRQALAKLKAEQPIEIILRSFELDPDAPLIAKEDIYTQLANKYQMSLPQARDMTQGVVKQGQSVGLSFNFDKLQPTSTFDGHRLIHLAGQHQLMVAMAERLFAAFFTESLNIADKSVLLTLAIEVGLPEQAVIEMLNSEAFSQQVREDEQKARQMRITSVPFFVFNHQYAISGAQPENTFIEIINKLLAAA